MLKGDIWTQQHTPTQGDAVNVKEEIKMICLQAKDQQVPGTGTESPLTAYKESSHWHLDPDFQPPEMRQ